MKTLPLIVILNLLVAGTSLSEPPANPPKAVAENPGTVKLKLQAYDGDSAKPESMTFQINPIGLRQPTEFLGIGNTIANTKYRIDSFSQKTQKDPATGEQKDISEVILVHTVTKKKLVLPMGVPVAIE